MPIYDLTGPIFDGMWTYGGTYGQVVVREVPPPDFVRHVTYSWRMELSVQSGTYLETSRHVRRDDPPLIDVPLEDLWMRDCAVLQVPRNADEAIRAADLEACGVPVRPGDAVIVGTGWDRHWREPDFISHCPWFLREAMDWLLDREPFLIGGDMPRFDSWEQPQGFWDRFFGQRTLLLAPLVNVMALRRPRVKLCALPMKLEESCAAPCRVVAVEED